MKKGDFGASKLTFLFVWDIMYSVMKPYRYESTFKTDFCDVDFKDERKISSFLSLFEVAASASAEELGFGYSYLKPRGYAFFSRKSVAN